MATQAERAGGGNASIGERRGVPLGPLLIGIGATVAIFIFILLVNHFEQKPAGTASAAYLSQVQVKAQRVLAAETMMAGSVTYVDGNMTNLGDRPVTALFVSLTFRDAVGQVVQVERNQIVNARSGPLEPKSSRDFRVGFDHISAEWNQRPPEIKAVSVYIR